MFRGTYIAKIDEKDRLKMPAGFRKIITEQYGDDIFITSLDGLKALLYPLATWNEIEERIARIQKMNPSKERFLRFSNYFGLQSKLDNQGRTGLPQTLRDKAGLNGEVVVLGMQDHLEIWNHDKFAEMLEKEPFTSDDKISLSELGI